MWTSSETLLSQFIDAWNAGKRPDVDAYLARAAGDDRDGLQQEIRTFLLHAPTPSYSDETRAEIRSEPLTQTLGRMPDELGLWPTLLPTLRRRERLQRDQLVAKLAEALGVSGSERKVARYYHDMETGTLDPAGVSARVLRALGSLLGVSERELEEAGAFEGFTRSTPQAAFGRTYDVASGELLAMPPAAASPSTEQEWDEVDKLFLGGR
jgi:hypothetical protein